MITPMRILDCRMNEVLYESTSTRVFRGLHQPSGQRIIVKQARATRTSIIARLRREYRLAREISGAAVVEPIAFCEEQSVNEPPAIIYADFGGVALSNFLREAMDVTGFLELASQLARILQAVHENQIVHQDIKPANIIINPATGEARLTDFGIAVQNDGGMMPARRTRGTRAHMAPEQSGRMNRAIDHRADLYSLGITCYEALTGQLPFDTSEDTLEMIPRHLAVRPVDPHLLRPKIPGVVSAIIMKLLAKDAEDRYQSAAGLRADFEECRRQWLANGSIRDIEIGRGDVPDTFSVSAKTFGRDRERVQLLDLFRRVLRGHREVCFLRGFSGIGKSSVALGIQDAVLESRAYFVTGKFDQYQAGIPYSAILRAFRSLLTEILKEDSAQIEGYRQKLEVSLGQNGRVVTDVIPELDRIIGEQPEVPAVPPEEAENRFVSIFYKFVRALVHDERPLVLFLDDLQWADVASLRLIRLLLSTSEITGLLVLGAYRDNEVGSRHPLGESIEQLRTIGVSPHIIDIGPLGFDEVNALVAATLKAGLERTQELANFIYQKTGGNPFFIREFLLKLHREGHIRASSETRGWVWDARAISKLPAPDQIGALMAQKIAELEGESRFGLQFAACIGSRFEMALLARTLERPEAELSRDLQSALREGLISPLFAASADGVRDQEQTIEVHEREHSFQFQHDRIQQAAYESMAEHERIRIHRRIAQDCVRHAEEAGESLQDVIFVVIHHLDASEALGFADAAEQLRAAGYYCMGGRKALDSAAYQAAADALRRGVDLLPEDCWTTCPELTRNLHELSAEAEHLCSRNEYSVQLVETILAHTPDALSRLPAYEIYLRALIALGDMPQVVEIGLRALTSLGYEIPGNPGTLRALWSILRAELLIRFRGPAWIRTAPPMRDKTMIAATRILALLASGAYKTRPNLYAVGMARYAELSYYGGRAATSAYGLVSLAVLLVSIRRFKLAEQLSRVALDIVDRQDDLAAKTFFAHGAFVSHWLEDMSLSIESLNEGQRLGFLSGDIEYGGYCVFFRNVHGIYATVTLEDAERDLAANYQLGQNFRNENALYVTRIYYELVRRLRAPPEEGSLLHGEIFDAERDLNILHTQGFHSEICVYHCAQALLCFLTGEQTEAENSLRKSIEHKAYVRSMYFVPHLAYMRGLTMARGYDSRRSLVARVRCRFRLGRVVRELAWLARLNPATYQSKYTLLRAEQARIAGQTRRIADLYNQAIEEASERGFLMDEAIACERVARHYVDAGNMRIARNYLQDARRLYNRWGARHKVGQLVEEFPEIFAQSAPVSGRATLENTIAFATRTEAGDLDIETVTKAVQMLFAGQSASTVMNEFLRLSLENAGAQRGCLVLQRGEQLWLEALLEPERQEYDFLAQPFDSYRAVPRDVLHYVLHSGQSVVLGNAPEDGAFTTDAYVACSIWKTRWRRTCLPGRGSRCWACFRTRPRFRWRTRGCTNICSARSGKRRASFCSSSWPATGWIRTSCSTR
mgnify:CR=1 FL=1